MRVIQEVCSQFLPDDNKVTLLCAFTKRDLRVEKNSWRSPEDTFETELLERKAAVLECEASGEAESGQWKQPLQLLELSVCSPALQ